MFKLSNYFIKQDEAASGEESGGGGATEAVSIEQFNEIQSQLESVLAKNNELLGEAKTAKQKLREFESAKNQELEEAAKKKGDYEQLYKSAEQKAAELQSQLENMMQSSASEKINTQALKLASELAEGHNIDLLSGFIAQRLKYTDGDIKVTDQNGELSVTTLDELKNEFKSNEKFSSLIAGNKSTGGGATGNNGGSAAKEMTRSDFDKLSPDSQMKFIKSGGTLT